MTKGLLYAGHVQASVDPTVVALAYHEMKGRGEETIRAEADGLESEMHKINAAVGGDYDFGSKALAEMDGFGDDAQANVRRVVNLHSRLGACQDLMAESHAAAQAREEMLAIRQSAARDHFDRADTMDGGVREVSLSDHFISSVQEESGIEGSDFNVNAALQRLGGNIAVGTPRSAEGMRRYLNATVTTDAGWDPFVRRQPGHTRFISRPLQVVDTIPMSSTNQHSIKYMLQTKRESSAKAVAEGAASDDATMEWREYTEPMREIVAHIPVTELQLEDEPQLRAIIDADLRLMVLQELDGQLLLGDGSSERIRGMTVKRTVDGQDHDPVSYTWTVTGSGANRRRSDQLVDMKKAKTRLKLMGRVMPNVFYVHDEIWDEMSLRETSAAGFYLGSPANDFQPRLWGLPAILTDHLSARPGPGAGTQVVIADTSYMRHWSRRMIHTEIGRIDNQFIRRTLTIRAGLRCLLQVRRPQAILNVSMPS